jgi:hypothetical protein
MRKIIFFVMMMLAVSVSAQVNIANGLLAYYPYNGNANDESGNGYNGFVNGPTLTIDRFGASNKAYSFSGNTISANIPYNFDNDFSHNFWFKVINQNMVSGFFSWGDFTGSDYNSYSSFGASSGTLYTTLIEVDNISNCDLNAGVISNASGNFDNNWHMATTVKAGTTISLYIDTILIGSTNILDSCNVFLDIISFRVGNSLVGLQFTGSVDDIMFYSRALNSTEISYLYNLNSSWSSPTATELISENNINIYPNPVDNLANISFTENGIYNIQVVDMTGRLIYTAQVSDQNLQLNTSSWAAGMYRLNIFSENGQFESKTIVKE